MIEKKEVVFLLGAGASVDAGLPTAMRLANHVEDDLIANYPQLLSALRFISGAVIFGKACRGQPIGPAVNIEEILSACLFLNNRETSYAYPFVGAWHERIRSLEILPNEIPYLESRDTFRFLSDYCKKGLQTWLKVTSEDKVAYLSKLVDFIKRGFTPRVFTLNYDECVELALHKSVGEINQAWTTGFDRDGWKPQLFENEYKAYLYKLHGSLDWINDQKLGICSLKWPYADLSDELPPDLDPLLIFGIDTKFQPTDPFLTLLFHFRQSLIRAKIVVIIGYSFGDAHINAMLLEAMQRSNQMRCISANTSPLEELLPHDSNFRRMLNLEERFIPLSRTAAEVLNSGELLDNVLKISKQLTDELPF